MCRMTWTDTPSTDPQLKAHTGDLSLVCMPWMLRRYVRASHLRGCHRAAPRHWKGMRGRGRIMKRLERARVRA
jgi:hypothetical protein